MLTPVVHHTFCVERSYKASAERVFAAMRDPVKKQRWFAEGDGFVLDSYTLDFRVGGFERTRFRPEGGPPMTNDCLFLDIVENERIVFAYNMTLAGAPLTSSLGTMEFVVENGGTRLRYTEQIAYLDGKDGSEGRLEGTRGLFEALAKELEAHA